MANKAKLEALLTLVNTSARDAIALYEQNGGDVPSMDQMESHPLDDALDQVALKTAIRTLEGAFAQLTATLAPPAHTVINVRTRMMECIQPTITDMISYSLFKCTIMLAYDWLFGRISRMFFRTTRRDFTSMSSPKLSTSSRRNWSE